MKGTSVLNVISQTHKGKCHMFSWVFRILDFKKNDTRVSGGQLGKEGVRG